MRKMFYLMMAAIAVAVTGCASVEMSAPGSLAGIDVVGAVGKPDRQIVVSNGGMYALWLVTVGTGDIRWNEVKQDINGGTILFEDYSGMENILSALNHYAIKYGRNLADVVLNEGSQSDLQLTSYGGVGAGLVGFNAISVSAVMCEKDEVKKEDK